MLQDIFPHTFDVSFRPLRPQADDPTFVFRGGQVLLRDTREMHAVPKYGDLLVRCPAVMETAHFLFSIDTINFFLGGEGPSAVEGFAYRNIQIFREFTPSWLGFAGATAAHLAAWFAKNRYCGRCAAPLQPSTTERALLCPACGNTLYPAIAPAIIVGIIDGDRLLMTRYARGEYKKPVLIAGFMEIGETMEDAIRREVREEVGVEITNIRYYKSQPWPFSQSMLAGFFADLHGSAQLTVDGNELSEAVWIPRDQIPAGDSAISLTHAMIEAFRRREV